MAALPPRLAPAAALRADVLDCQHDRRSAPKAVKAAKKASVAKVQIVSQKSGRYVVVRVSGATKTARIKVTLIGSTYKVLKVASARFSRIARRRSRT